MRTFVRPHNRDTKKNQSTTNQLNTTGITAEWILYVQDRIIIRSKEPTDIPGVANEGNIYFAIDEFITIPRREYPKRQLLILKSKKMLIRLVTQHAFYSANKRAGWAILKSIVRRNKYRLVATKSEKLAFLERVANPIKYRLNNIDSYIITWLNEHIF